MRIAKGLVLVGVIIVAVSLLLSGCSKSSTPSTTKETAANAPAPASDASPNGSPTLDEIQKRGVIKIGVSLKFPPVQYRDDKGEPTGFDVEVAKMVAADLGVKAEFVDLDWDALIPALLSKKVDILWAGHTNTPKRALVVEFGGRLEKTDVVMVVPANSNLKSKDELNDPKKTITVLLGSTSEKAAKMIFPKANIRSLQQQEALLEVEAKRADASILDRYTAVPFVKKHPGTKILKEPSGEPVVVSREYGHAAMRKGDQGFVNWVNNWIDFYRAAGTLDALEDKWIGPAIKE